MKNLDIKQILPLLRSLLTKVQRYSTFAFIISILLIYGFLVVRIGVLSQSEPSEDAIAEKSNTVKRLKFDQSSVDKIEQLEDQSVEVQSLFKSARDNPFEE